MSAEKGSKITIHYKGTLEDGTVFDQSSKEAPLSFTIGSGEIIEGLDSEVIGLTKGDKKTINVPADKAYGPRHEEMIGEVPKENFPEDLAYEIGDSLVVQTQEGQDVQVKVMEIKEEAVILDGNHELAGKDLIFEIEVLEVA